MLVFNTLKLKMVCAYSKLRQVIALNVEINLFCLAQFRKGLKMLVFGQL